jgi:hypothetical protein
MVGIDDLVAELELDVLDLAGDLEVLCQRVFFTCLCGNGCSSFVATDRVAALDSSLQVAIHEI